MKKFDITIIGGGHAGVEAAHIAAKFNLSVGLISLSHVSLGSAPCNPAIGGVGKGQVVRELDALGGLMGKCADRAGIQFRILNDSKGFAVRSTRVQIDKNLYPQIISEELSKISNITILKDLAIRVVKSEEGFLIELSSGEKIEALKLIVTTGTFLGGKLHCGEEQKSGGRVHVPASPGLAELFPNFSIRTLRFKTGTPPRLYTHSIDFSKMQVQESDPNTTNFHQLHERQKRFSKQNSCYLTRTNLETLTIIRENRERSPIFNGQIKGVGPRYCPSIEDKAFRYPDRNGHHIFIEPESGDGETVYPNGISTSLPKDVQERFIRSIAGLEKAEFAVYGYAVEYDAVDTTQLNRKLEHKQIVGLYFAGQVNGTSGYEEAAGQGIMAGINAALSFQGRELILSRENSYIGVMIEDLVMNQRDEPYRLFTARAENRLSIREDNTILRMYNYRKELKLNEDIDSKQSNYMIEYNSIKSFIYSDLYRQNTENRRYFCESGYGELTSNITLAELMRRSQLDPIKCLKDECKKHGILASEEILEMVAIEIYYEGYIDQAEEQNQRLLKLKEKKISWEEFVTAQNVSFECRQRIKASQPENFGALMAITGLRPATLAYVAGRIS